MSKLQQIQSKTLYKGRVATLTQDTLKTVSGEVVQRETIHHPMSVVILPVHKNKEVALIRQYRHAIGKVIYELPAGCSEPGETSLQCAKRELAEETGLAAKTWKKQCLFYPAPGISTEKMILYRAETLEKLANPPAADKDEMITLKMVSVKEALKLVETNKIIDAKSMLGLIWGLNKVNWK